MLKNKKLKMPHAYVILLMIVIFCTALTWVLPAGQFDRVEDPDLGRELVVAGSYQSVEANPVDPWEFTKALYEGMTNAAEIIFFVFFAYGYVFIIIKTGSIDAAVGSLLRLLRGKDYLLIPVFMIFFGIAGSTVGMYEETYGLIPAFIAIAMTLGYDRLVGGAIVFVGVATGFAAATINPFTIGIASSIAGIPLVTPEIFTFRIVAFCLFMTLSIGYVMFYANKIKKDPTKSLCYGYPSQQMGEGLSRDEVMELPFTKIQKATILGFVALIAAIAIGVVVYGFYLTELSALFIIWMIFTGILNKMTFSKLSDSFVEAVQSSVYGVLIIGIARSIEVIMSQSNIIDTAVLYISDLISAVPVGIAAIGMLVAQNLINFFIPSGSGQAVVVMPIMAPLADVVGLSREVAVLAYQFGDGFSNMFWPTAVAVECGIMGLGMNQWYKFITPLFGMMFILQAILMSVAVVIGI